MCLRYFRLQVSMVALHFRGLSHTANAYRGLPTNRGYKPEQVMKNLALLICNYGNAIQKSTVEGIRCLSGSAYLCCIVLTSLERSICTAYP